MSPHADNFTQNLKYLGFWDSGSRNGQVIPLENLSSIAKTSIYTNTSVISVVMSHDGNVSTETIDSINLAIQKKEHVVLITWTAFMNYPVTNDDFVSKWEIVKTQLINPNLSWIVALYIADEPFYNARIRSIPLSKVKEGLDTQIAIMKFSYPRLPIYMTYSTPELNNQDVLNYGPAVDWVAANVYFMAEHDPAFVKTYLDKLLAQKKPTQQIALTMDSWFIGSLDNNGRQVCIVSPEAEKGSIDFNSAMVEWVNNHPEIIVTMVLTFLYNNQLTQTENLCGAESMPMALDYINSIHNSIK